MKHDDGGPAFPRTAANPEWGLGTESFEGMTLWDYFAAHALASASVDNFSAENMAEWASSIADAMIAERKKRMETKL